MNMSLSDSASFEGCGSPELYRSVGRRRRGGTPQPLDVGDLQERDVISDNVSHTSDWVSMTDAEDTSTMSHVRLVSYNILACCHYTNERYPYAEAGNVMSDARAKHLYNVLARLNADLLALQEVSQFQYEHQESLGGRLREDGFEGKLQLCTAPNGQAAPEGVATFWRRQRYSMIHARTISFNLVESSPSFGGSATRRRSHNVALVIALECRRTRAKVLVANTHASWNSSEQQQQMESLLSTLDEMRRELCAGAYVVLTGDFNAPTHSPSVSTALSSKCIRLRSAYANYFEKNGNHVTTFKDESGGVVDHVLHDERLHCRALVSLAPPKVFTGTGVPSDHYPIGAVFSVSVTPSPSPRLGA